MHHRLGRCLTRLLISRDAWITVFMDITFLQIKETIAPDFIYNWRSITAFGWAWDWFILRTVCLEVVNPYARIRLIILAIDHP